MQTLEQVTVCKCDRCGEEVRRLGDFASSEEMPKGWLLVRRLERCHPAADDKELCSECAHLLDEFLKRKGI